MITYRNVTVKFSGDNIDDKVQAWLNQVGPLALDLPDLTFPARVEFDVDDFDEVEIVAAYDDLNKLDDSDLYHVGLAYRRLAEGDVADAMDILSRQFHLAPPHHEKRVADLLSTARS